MREGSDPTAKDVGQCSANLEEIENEDEGNPYGNNDPDLNITMWNAFPSYNCTVIFEKRNGGTVPHKILFRLSGNYQYISEDPLRFYLMEGDVPAVECTSNMTSGVELDPGESVWFKLSCHVLQGAEERGTYNVQIYLDQVLFVHNGCTPGYWKNHPESWPDPYTPSDVLGAVFAALSNSVPFDGYSPNTLMDALNFGGGSGTDGAARILLRHGVAALLNAASPSVNYPLTVSEVVNSVNNAIDSNDRGTMLDLVEVLDAYNNAGCPLD